MKNKKLIQGLKDRDHAVIKSIYDNYFPLIDNFIRCRSGSKEEAKDIFQETIKALLKNIADESFELRCKFSTYLIKIAANQWRKAKRKKNRDSTEYFIRYETKNEISFRPEIEVKQIKLYLKHFNEMCEESKKILILDFEGKSIPEIQKKMGFRDAQTTMDKKYRCKKKLRESIQNDPLFTKLKNELLITD